MVNRGRERRRTRENSRLNPVHGGKNRFVHQADGNAHGFA
jgi:hypothetical protein